MLGKDNGQVAWQGGGRRRPHCWAGPASVCPAWIEDLALPLCSPHPRPPSPSFCKRWNIFTPNALLSGFTRHTTDAKEVRCGAAGSQVFSRRVTSSGL